jgi:hypothetical protein
VVNLEWEVRDQVVREKAGLPEDRVLADVDTEGIGRPTADGLYEVVTNTRES